MPIPHSRSDNDSVLGSEAAPERITRRRDQGHKSLLDSIRFYLKTVYKLAANFYDGLLLMTDLPILIPVSSVVGKGRASSNNSISKRWIEVTAMIFHSENADAQQLLASVAIAGVLFGAIHFFAWKFTFPSTPEQSLWRNISVTIVVISITLFLSALCWYPLAEVANGSKNRVSEILSKFALYFIIFINSYLALGTYPVSRLFLLILAFTSLRSLPPSAFDTVNWIELVPHI